jgi:undecaprenyl-diphosphatase
MGIGHAIILGIVQGLAEFLPISSSAHEALIHNLLGWHTPDDLLFDVALHVGLVLAVVTYFFKDWVQFIKRWREPMLWYILVACVPGGIFGVLLEKKAETVFRAPLRIALMLFLFGLVMAWAERVSKQTRDLEKMGWRDAIWIGLAQCFALMPGVSRSGATMTAGLFLGLTREASARFSFLLSAPIILGAALWEGHKYLHGGLPIGPAPLLAGILSATVVGLFVIHFLLQYLRNHTLYVFTAYRLVLAVAVVAAVLLLRAAGA